MTESKALRPYWEIGRTYIIRNKDKYDNELVEYTLFRITSKCLGFTYDDPHAGKITIRRKWLLTADKDQEWEVVDTYME